MINPKIQSQRKKIGRRGNAVMVFGAAVAIMGMGINAHRMIKNPLGDQPEVKAYQNAFITLNQLGVVKRNIGNVVRPEDFSYSTDKLRPYFESIDSDNLERVRSVEAAINTVREDIDKMQKNPLVIAHNKSRDGYIKNYVNSLYSGIGLAILGLVYRVSANQRLKRKEKAEWAGLL